MHDPPQSVVAFATRLSATLTHAISSVKRAHQLWDYEKRCAALGAASV
jgi:hypothetical protein